MFHVFIFELLLFYNQLAYYRVSRRELVLLRSLYINRSVITTGQKTNKRSGIARWISVDRMTMLVPVVVKKTCVKLSHLRWDARVGPSGMVHECVYTSRKSDNPLFIGYSNHADLSSFICNYVLVTTGAPGIKKEKQRKNNKQTVVNQRDNRGNALKMDGIKKNRKNRRIVRYS